MIQRIGKINDVLTNCRLPGRSRRRSIQKTWLGKTAQGKSNRAMAGVRRRRFDAVIGVRVIGETVQH